MESFEKSPFLVFELFGYIMAALLLGRYTDAYFSLKGKGTLAFVLLVYVLWFYRFFKMYR